MWRLLIVAVIALIPMAASQMAHEAGYQINFGSWLQRPERPSFANGQLPPAGWQERAYLAANPDVAAAVRDGTFESGYEHFRLAGMREGRTGGFPASRTVAEVPAR